MFNMLPHSIFADACESWVASARDQVELQLIATATLQHELHTTMEKALMSSELLQEQVETALFHARTESEERSDRKKMTPSGVSRSRNYKH